LKRTGDGGLLRHLGTVAEPRKPEKGLKLLQAWMRTRTRPPVAEPRKPEKGLKLVADKTVLDSGAASQNPENPRRD